LSTQTSQSTVPITVKATDSKTDTEPITAPTRRTHEIHLFSSPSGDPEQWTNVLTNFTAIESTIIINENIWNKL